MKKNHLDLGNRRSAFRLTEQLPVRYAYAAGESDGVTINVSESGARVYLRHAVASPFRLSIATEPAVSFEAHTVWEEPLVGGGRIVGVRFTPAKAEMEALKYWIAGRRQFPK